MSILSRTFIRTIKTQHLNRNTSNNIKLIKRATGDTESAVAELRWLTEHVHQQFPSTSPDRREAELLKLCEKRGEHVPLQYILGTQPFGELEIKCRSGVLIPRPETEAYTLHLSKTLKSGTLSKLFLGKSKTSTEKGRDSPTLNILDLCSGSGCISLLLHRHLQHAFSTLSINGWDISPLAIALSNENLSFNISQKHLNSTASPQVHFHQGDIFNPSSSSLEEQLQNANIIISNPPYISEEHFQSETEESVRKFEPKLALVPEPKVSLNLSDSPRLPAHAIRSEDVFYHQIISYYTRLPKCLIVVMEVGDNEQAKRVVEMALKREEIRIGSRVEIWRDWPDQDDSDGEGEDCEKSVEIDGKEAMVVGAGKMRAVVIVREVESRE